MTEVPATTGGLGGLGGIVNSRGFGNLLQAAGMSMMGAPRNNPLRDFGKFYGGIQDEQRLEANDARALAERDQSYEARVAALMASNVPEQEARIFARDPNAMTIRLNQLKADQAKASDDQWRSQFPDIGSADASGTTPESAVTYSGVSDASALPPILARPQVPQEYGGANALSQPGAGQAHYRQFTPGSGTVDDTQLEPIIPPGPGAEIPLSGVSQNKQNRTVEWLKKNAPEEASLLDQGLSPKDAMDIAIVNQKSRKPAQTQVAQTQAQPGPVADLNELYRKRDTVAKYLAQAPMGVSKEALDRGRAYFDIYDAQIKRAEEAQKASQPPDAVRALKMRAELAGLQPGTPEYQKFMIAGGGKDSLVTINNSPEGETFAGLPKDVRAEIFKRQGEAQDAADLIGVTNQGLQLLDQGAITGAGSDTKISTIKWAQTLGVPVDGDIVDAANNSETYRSIMAKAVGKVIKNFGSGTGLSDADRQYAEKLAGGDTTLNEPAIRRILAAGSSQAQDQIKRFSTMRDKVLGGDLGAMLDVPDPGKYTPAPMPSGSAPRARNPQTGQTLEWDGSQWRPAQ